MFRFYTPSSRTVFRSRSSRSRVCRIRISFNSQYLMDVIRNVEAEEIRMCFQTNVSPCIVRPKEGNQFTFLVLPIRTFD